jgi:hypothetical protein
MDDRACYTNPSDKFSLQAIAAVAMIGIVFSLVTIAAQWKWGASAIVMVGSLMIMYAGLYREIISRPKIVRVGEDGVLLKYRTWKPLFVPWDGIEWVDAVSADKSTLKGKDTVEGRMKIRAKRWPMQLTYEIAHAVQIKYNEQLGRYPTISPSLAQRREFEARQRVRR